MKIIKNLVALVLFAFTFASASAQSNETKELLTNKWIIDKEAMKPSIGIMLATNPEYAALDAAGKEEFLNRIIDEQLSGIKIEYKKDGSFTATNPDGSVTTGTWSISADGKELTTKSLDKPEKKRTVAAISKTKLHIFAEGNRELFLKSEN